MTHRSHRARVAAALVALSACALLNSAAWAQKSKGKDEVEIPPPEDIVLETNDGLQLHATYYAGVEAERRGHDIVPVVLLHGYKGNRHELADLALYLQGLQSADGQHNGHAVIAPDLRGHGDSIHLDGRDRALDVDRLKPDDFRRMARFDVEEIKKFLMAKNNAGELNIEKLCVVGADMGAVVAATWAAQDWSWPVLPGQKQGRDVKALVFLSPERDFKGMSIYRALDHPALRTEVSVLISVGDGNSRALSDARSIHSRLERFHPEPPESEAAERKSLFYDPHKTALEGTKMLGEKLGVEENIAQFITLRLVNKPYKWTDRSKVLGN